MQDLSVTQSSTAPTTGQALYMCRRDNNGCLPWALVQQDALIVLSVFALMHMHNAENLKTQALLRAAARICKNTAGA